MGQDKALLEIQGVPLLRRTCKVARHCTATVKVITFWPDRYFPITPTDCQLIQERPLPDWLDNFSLGASGDRGGRGADWHGDSWHHKPSETASHGPLIGFAQGLPHFRADWILLLACDLPNLQPTVLTQWQQELAQIPATTMACLPEGPKGWEPLCGFYRRQCQPDLLSFIVGGGRSFQTWLTHHSVQALPPVDPQLLFNCNTPEDLTQVSVSPHQAKQD